MAAAQASLVNQGAAHQCHAALYQILLDRGVEPAVVLPPVILIGLGPFFGQVIPANGGWVQRTGIQREERVGAALEGLADALQGHRPLFGVQGGLVDGMNQ